MATKKQNKRHVVRQTRRLLNQHLDTPSVSNRRLYATHYGAGPSSHDLRLRGQDDDPTFNHDDDLQKTEVITDDLTFEDAE
ncbi:hypothetical protein RPALISO_39 [Ruegeria phage RpAliso]|nr:hypothetical protein RPALISO_39 [Ruegeria phage RpAliso]